jgi:hypothetical protein
VVRHTALQKKTAILDGLITVRSEIVDTVQSLPLEKQSQVFLGSWDIKDLLAHLVGWDYTNIQMARQVQNNQLPDFYSYYDRDWRSYNAELVSRYRVDDFTEMLAATRVSHQQLIVFLKSLPPDEFFKDRGLRYKGYKVLLGRLLEAELKDENTHLEQIKQFAGS